MNNFLAKLIIEVLTSEKVKEMVRELFGNLITERILPLVPVVIAGAVKAAVDQIVEKVPELEGVVDAMHVADKARDSLSELIPDIDIGIPALDNLLDFWRK